MSRVLVVEDEAHLAQGLRFNLEAEGHAVEVAGDGESALARLLDKRSSICVSGKMKNPPMTMVAIAAFGVTQLPSIAETSQITELTSCPQKPPMYTDRTSR